MTASFELLGGFLEVSGGQEHRAQVVVRLGEVLAQVGGAAELLLGGGLLLLRQQDDTLQVGDLRAVDVDVAGVVEHHHRQLGAALLEVDVGQHEHRRDVLLVVLEDLLALRRALVELVLGVERPGQGVAQAQRVRGRLDPLLELGFALQRPSGAHQQLGVVLGGAVDLGLDPGFRLLVDGLEVALLRQRVLALALVEDAQVVVGPVRTRVVGGCLLEAGDGAVGVALDGLAHSVVEGVAHLGVEDLHLLLGRLLPLGLLLLRLLVVGLLGLRPGVRRGDLLRSIGDVGRTGLDLDRAGIAGIGRGERIVWLGLGGGARSRPEPEAEQGAQQGQAEGAHQSRSSPSLPAPAGFLTAGPSTVSTSDDG
ncbi:MAG: hypothetical protein QM765_47465 [Myxococcales bacterium]